MSDDGDQIGDSGGGPPAADLPRTQQRLQRSDRPASVMGLDDQTKSLADGIFAAIQAHACDPAEEGEAHSLLAKISQSNAMKGMLTEQTLQEVGLQLQAEDPTKTTDGDGKVTISYQEKSTNDQADKWRQSAELLIAGMLGSVDQSTSLRAEVIRLTTERLAAVLQEADEITETAVEEKAQESFNEISTLSVAKLRLEKKSTKDGKELLKAQAENTELQRRHDSLKDEMSKLVAHVKELSKNDGRYDKLSNDQAFIKQEDELADRLLKIKSLKEYRTDLIARLQTQMVLIKKLEDDSDPSSRTAEEQKVYKDTKKEAIDQHKFLASESLTTKKEIDLQWSIMGTDEHSNPNDKDSSVDINLPTNDDKVTSEMVKGIIMQLVHCLQRTYCFLGPGLRHLVKSYSKDSMTYVDPKAKVAKRAIECQEEYIKQNATLFYHLEKEIGKNRLASWMRTTYHAGLSSEIEVKCFDGDGMSVLYYLLSKFATGNVHLRTANMQAIENLIPTMQNGNLKMIVLELEQMIKVGVERHNYQARADTTVMLAADILGQRYPHQFGNKFLEKYREGGVDLGINLNSCTKYLQKMLEEILMHCEKMRQRDPEYWKTSAPTRNAHRAEQKSEEKRQSHKQQRSKMDPKQHKGKAHKLTDKYQKLKASTDICKVLMEDGSRCTQVVCMRPKNQGPDQICLFHKTWAHNNKPCDLKLTGGANGNNVIRFKEPIQAEEHKDAGKAKKGVKRAKKQSPEDEQGSSSKKKTKTTKKVGRAEFTEDALTESFSAPSGGQCPPTPETASEGEHDSEEEPELFDYTSEGEEKAEAEYDEANFDADMAELADPDDKVSAGEGSGGAQPHYDQPTAVKGITARYYKKP
jgi:hypothetical protein